VFNYVIAARDESGRKHYSGFLERIPPLFSTKVGRKSASKTLCFRPDAPHITSWTHLAIVARSGACASDGGAKSANEGTWVNVAFSPDGGSQHGSQKRRRCFRDSEFLDKGWRTFGNLGGPESRADEGNRTATGCGRSR